MSQSRLFASEDDTAELCRLSEEVDRLRAQNAELDGIITETALELRNAREHSKALLREIERLRRQSDRLCDELSNSKRG